MKLTTGVSKAETVAGGGNVHGTGHGSLAHQPQVVDHHGGWREQASQVQELKLPKLGEEQHCGGEDGHGLDQHGLGHGDWGGGQWPQYAQVHHRQLLVDTQLAIPTQHAWHL